MKDDSSAKSDDSEYEETTDSAVKTKPNMIRDNKIIKCLFIILIQVANIRIFQFVFKQDSNVFL